MELIDRLGFDVVDAGPLEPGTAIFIGECDRAGLENQLALPRSTPALR